MITVRELEAEVARLTAVVERAESVATGYAHTVHALKNGRAADHAAAEMYQHDKARLRARVEVLEKALRDVLEKLEWCVGAGSDIPAITRARAALKAEGAARPAGESP